MPISTGTDPRPARDGYVLVDPAAGEITIIAVERHGTLTFDPASPLGWMTAAALALANAGWGMRVLEWMPAIDGRYAMGVRQLDDAARGAAAAGDPLAELHAAYTEWHDGDASSNDVDQALDDFLTKRGYPTVLYRERPKRRRQ